MNIKEIKATLLNHNWTPFYSENNWIAPGGSDYSGVTLCEAYITVTKKDLSPQEKFNEVMKLEYKLNVGKRLYIHGKTYEFKDDLKNKFNAKWDKDQKLWYVDASFIKNNDFHEYCYNKQRNFKFKWEKVK